MQQCVDSVIFPVWPSASQPSLLNSERQTRADKEAVSDAAHRQLNYINTQRIGTQPGKTLLPLQLQDNSSTMVWSCTKVQSMPVILRKVVWRKEKKKKKEIK